MSLIKAAAVNFGTSQTGLSTVGYTLISADGTTKQARTTTGVSEVQALTGMYQATMTFDDDWQGQILWDTGAATPRYAIESFDYLQFTGGGGGFSPAIVTDSIWTREEKKKLQDQVRKILKALKATSTIQEGVNIAIESTNTISRRIALLTESMPFKDVLTQLQNNRAIVSGQLEQLKKATNGQSERRHKELIESVAESSLKLLEQLQEAQDTQVTKDSMKDVNEQIQQFKLDLVEVIKTVNVAVKIGTRFVSTEDLTEILKEEGTDAPKIVVK